MTLFYVRNPLECNISVDSSLTYICKGFLAETLPHHLMCYCFSSIMYRGSSNLCYLNYTGFDCKRTRNKSVSSIKMYYITCFVYCFYNTLLVAPYIKMIVSFSVRNLLERRVLLLLSFTMVTYFV